MIALHACDTATDHAIDLGVRAGAAILDVLAVLPQGAAPADRAAARCSAGLLRHGIHLGQEAEMVTDSLRALLLETCGYDAQVFEFVSLEHTSKNKMILARRGAAGAAQRARAQRRDRRAQVVLRHSRAAPGDAAREPGRAGPPGPTLPLRPARRRSRLRASAMPSSTSMSRAASYGIGL